MIKKLRKLILPQNDQVQSAIIYRNILRDAAKMGGEVFGPIPAGRRREFFCLDEHTWVWHEEWNDERGAHQVRTTRYDVRPHGIFKAQDGQPIDPSPSRRRIVCAMPPASTSAVSMASLTHCLPLQACKIPV